MLLFSMMFTFFAVAVSWQLSNYGYEVNFWFEQLTSLVTNKAPFAIEFLVEYCSSLNQKDARLSGF